MVVSVDISGTLEERLRRLVDLGIYASVSEAVRDALRRLMDELDLFKIGLSLYKGSDVTLNYICEFVDAPCTKVLAYFLESGVIPLLGRPEYPPQKLIPENLLLSPTTLFIAYTTYLGSLLWKLRENGIKLFICNYLEKDKELWEAYSFHKGIMKHILSIETLYPCNKFKIKLNQKTIISSYEKQTIIVAKTCNIPVLVSDRRFKNILEKMNINYIDIIELLYESRRRSLISGDEALDIVMSLKTVPVIVPSSAMEDLR